MREVAAARQVQAHHAGVRRQQRCVHGKVGRAAGIGLHVYAPLLLVKTEGIQGALLAEVFNLVDDFVAAVVARPWLTLRVLVRERRTEALHHSPRREVFRGNELDGPDLPRSLLRDQGAHSWVHFAQRLVPRQLRAISRCRRPRGDTLRRNHSLRILVATLAILGLLLGDEARALQHAHDNPLEVQRVEMKPGGPAVEKSTAHLNALLDAPHFEGVVRGVGSLRGITEAGRQARFAECCHPLETAKVVQAHDTRDDRHVDAVRLACRHEIKEDLRVQKHLRDDKLCAGVDLLFQVVHLNLEVGVPAHRHNLLARLVFLNARPACLSCRQCGNAALDDLDVVRVALGVTSDRDGKIVAILFTHVLDKVQCTRETALGGRPLLLPAWRIAAERYDVADAHSLASIQSLTAHLRLLVGAREVHVSHAAKLILRGRRQCERELGGGTTSAPREVSEEWLERLHPHDSLFQVGNSLISFRGEVLEGEPTWRCFRHQVGDLGIISVSGGHCSTALKRRRQSRLM
mmetsp:Transcript_2761/g.3927  ORF Transcript_2761/g.3927 Transcript_2761/m.3927 type:complete len:518 (+) Transcript_2761:1199-2752(+)